MEIKNRRKLGEEQLTFVDGTNKVVGIYAVSNFEIMQLKRQYKKFSNINAKEPTIEIFEEEIILNTIKKAVGDQLSLEDLKQCENDLQELYTKYFTTKGVLTAEKKAS